MVWIKDTFKSTVMQKWCKTLETFNISPTVLPLETATQLNLLVGLLDAKHTRNRRGHHASSKELVEGHVAEGRGVPQLASAVAGAVADPHQRCRKEWTPSLMVVHMWQRFKEALLEVLPMLRRTQMLASCLSKTCPSKIHTEIEVLLPGKGILTT